MAAIVVLVPEITIRGVPSLKIVDRDEHGVGHRDHRLLVAGIADDATIARGQRAPAVANRAERRLGQGGPEPGIAPARLPGAMLAGTLVVAGTECRPTRQMAGAGEGAMSTPTSAMITSAVRCFTPGMVLSRWTASAQGVRSAPICCPSVSIASFT
jgi:hypothetical protein